MDLKSHNFGINTCGICNKIYSNREKGATHYGSWRSHIPLILQCGHSVCEFCIESSLRSNKGKVTCPDCKFESSWSQPVQNLTMDNQLRTEFPVNIYILGELTSSSNSKGVSNILSSNLLAPVPASTNAIKKQDLCVECSNLLAIVKCQQCGDKFCDTCFKVIHSSSKALSKHVAIPLAISSPGEEPLIKTLPNAESKCQTHNSYLVMYCSTCNVALCTTCYLKQHDKEHNVMTIEEKNTSVVEELKVASENVLPVLQRLKFNYQKLKSGVHSVSAPNASSLKELQQVEKNVRATISYIHAQLQLKEKKLLTSLAGYMNSSKKVTSDMASEMQDNIKSLNFLLENAQKVIEHPDKYSMDVENLLDRLKAVPEHTPCHIVTSPVDETAAKPKLDVDIESIKHALAHIVLTLPEYMSPISLLSTGNLPGSYVIPPIGPPALRTSDPKLVPSRPPSSMSLRSERSDSNSLADVRSTTSSMANSGVMIVKDFGSDISTPTGVPVKPITPCMPEEVVVVHINTPGDFYVQRKSAQPDLVKISCLIDPPFIMKQKPVSRVHLNDLYVAKFAADGIWYRARVTEIPPPNSGPDPLIKILYVDYGNRDTQPLSKIRLASNKLKTFPPLALHCAMYDCIPHAHTRVWSTESITQFVSLVQKDEENSVSMQVYSTLPHTNQYCVDLHVVGEYGTFSVRDTLFGSNLARNYNRDALSSASSVSSLMSLDSMPVPLKSTPPDIASVTSEPGLPKHNPVEVCVSCVESPDYFCVQRAKNMGAISRLSTELQHHYGEIQSNISAVTVPNILIGKIVACKINNVWYRGFITEKIVEEVESPLDPNVTLEEVKHVRVYAIDYGYKVLLPVADILKLHAKFFKMSAQALKCSLFGIAPARPPSKRSKDSGPSADDSSDTNTLIEETSDVSGSEKDPTWPPNIVDILNDLMGTGKRVVLMASNQDLKKTSGVQNVILYKRVGDREECINKTLVDMKIAKAVSPRVSSIRYKNSGKSSDTGSAKRETPKPGYQEKVKKHKLVKKLSGPRTAEFGRTDISTSETSEVSELESDSEEVEELRAAYKQVSVAHVQDPYHIYVTMFSRRKTLQDLSDDIQTHYSSLTPKKADSSYEVNDKCIAYLTDKAMFGRAVVKSITEDQAEVYFTDVGTQASVPVASLQPLDAKFSKEMDGTVACRLSGVLPADGSEAWPNFVVSKLREIVDQNRNCLYIYKSGPFTDGQMPVHLWVKKLKVAGPFTPSVTTWISVNKLLVSQACAHTAEPDEFTGPHFESPYTSDTLDNSDAAAIISTKLKSNKASLPPCGKSDKPDIVLPVAIHSAEVNDWLSPEPLASLELDITPTYVDYECRVFFVDPAKLELSSKIQTVLSAKYQHSVVRDSDMYWTEGQVCTVRYHLDMGWYRGKIVKLDEEQKYEVFFIDYGNMETCVPSELRKEACYHEVPALAISAVFHDIEPIGIPGAENKKGWPTPTLDLVHKLIVENPVKVTLMRPANPGEPYLIKEMKLASNGEDVIEVLLTSKLVMRSSDKKKAQKNQKTEQTSDQKEDKSYAKKKENTTPKEKSVKVLQKVDKAPGLKGCSDVLIPVKSPVLELPDEMEQLSLEPEQEVSESQDVDAETGHYDQQEDEETGHYDQQEDDDNAPVVQPKSSSLKNMSWYEVAEIEERSNEARNFKFAPPAIEPREGTVLKVKVKYISNLRPFIDISVILVEAITEKGRRVMADFTSLSANIQKDASTQPILREPGPDMKCIVCIEDEDDETRRIWHRACILAASDEGSSCVPVLCVDTGVKEVVDQESIRSIKEEWTKVPVQSISCILHGVDLAHDVEPENAMADLLELLSNRDEDFAFMRIKKCSYNGSLLVEIYEDPETTVLLYQSLIDSGSFLMENEVS